MYFAAALLVAAHTFVTPAKVGMAASNSVLDHNIERVVGDLRTTLILLKSGDTQLCFITSPLDVQNPVLNAACRALVGRQLGISAEQVVAAGSHDHTLPMVIIEHPQAWGRPGEYPPKSESNEFARTFLEGLGAAAAGLDHDLTAAHVEWGVAQENRITYNRRARRADGTAYFVREEDRQLLGEGYVGTIDPDATVVVFRSPAGRALAALASFTGHPVTGYNPEVPLSFGEWPQLGSEKLSAYLGGAPVGFLQGCAGDINSKFLLCGTVEQSREFGGWLGETLIRALGTLRPSVRMDLQASQVAASIPYGQLPSLADLERELDEITDFIRRGNAGDEDALFCVGMNFPRALTPPYRAKLVDMVRPWYEWAVQVRREGRVAEIPRALEMDLMVARIGDVGLIGLPFEAFVRTGLKIKREAATPCVLPCGYSGGEHGYIPDSTAVDDREYMGGFFRYTRFRPPYAAPGGDAAADAALSKLRQLNG